MISATLCAIIFPAPVVQVLPLERRSDRTSVFETGLTRARHEPAIGATKSTRLVGLRRSLARCLIPGFDGALFSREWKDALWDKFFTAAPQRQRQSVEQYKIVKRA